jgi:hypothetical protein
MKLTKDDKQAFVSAVMDDVPQIDYNELARKLIMDWAIAKLPDYVKRAYDEGWVETKHVSTPGLLSYVYAPLQERVCQEDMPAELWAQLEVLADAMKEQKEKLRQLNESVAASITGCSTLKQAKERLPEFEKYLPADRDGTGISNLPAISNTVAALVQAGWPKGKVPA